MTYVKLFIDDERYPVDSTAVVVRSSAEAIDYVIKNGLPNEIMFDHDLGGEDTSRVFVHWLSDWIIDNRKKFPVNFNWSVHSQNPIGRAYVDGYMKQLVGYIGYEE